MKNYSKKKENILITGGAGFIGSALALKLIKIGYNVRVLDNLSPQIHGKQPIKTSPLYQSISSKVDFILGTVTSKADWRKAINGQDAIIHLAAETGTGQSMYEIKRYIDINIGGTALMLDMLTNEKHKVKKVIIASSRAIYGEGKYSCSQDGFVYPTRRNHSDLEKGDFECKCPICGGAVSLFSTDEKSFIHPTSIYGITKHTQEEIALIVGNSLKIPIVVFRYQNVYGPGQSLLNPYTGILSIFSCQIKNSNNINIFEDGLEKRDFVYIDDVVKATILGLEKKEADYEVFNVGSGKPIDVLTIANALKSKFKSSIGINISGNYRMGDIRHNYADLVKIRTLLGYSPQFNFEDGIIKFCQWVNCQEINEDKYSLSIEEMKAKGLFK